MSIQHLKTILAMWTAPKNHLSNYILAPIGVDECNPTNFSLSSNMTAGGRRGRMAAVMDALRHRQAVDLCLGMNSNWMCCGILSQGFAEIFHRFFSRKNLTKLW